MECLGPPLVICQFCLLAYFCNPLNIIFNVQIFDRHPSNQTFSYKCAETKIFARVWIVVRLKYLPLDTTTQRTVVTTDSNKHHDVPTFILTDDSTVTSTDKGSTMGGSLSVCGASDR